MINAERETQCPFTDISVEEAYGPEVSLFLHCHLRGYDRHGEGKFPDQEYYDKYGAPMNKDNSWEEGYHVVEKKLAKHFNNVSNHPEMDFPLIAGMGGGAHLYKPIHGMEGDEPWNWTGWIPRQKRWLSQGTFFTNRYFLGLRGNEIQNDLWDYHPHDEEENEDVTDLDYTQLTPNDRYRGGYWFHRQPFGRYLHIIALKSHEVDPETNKCKRYNFIVHPLAYRPSIRTIPDNSVDAMQWCIINMPEEQHFGEGKPWGDKCHGLEIFNDYTYYYSYQKIEEEGPNNGELGKDKNNTINKDHIYYYWYDTYPLEFGVFLLDSALARGVYFHTMTATDAFYERHEPEFQSADPKGAMPAYNDKHCNKFQDPRYGVKAFPEPKQKSEISEVVDEIEKLPYKKNTAFGHATLFDPGRLIKHAVFTEESGIPCMGLNEGENLALDYLIKGKSFATTGVWDLFEYEYNTFPYKIYNQPDHVEICYDITDDMELVFTFLPMKKKNFNLIWRYTIMIENLNKITGRVDGLETTHGYFKMNPKGHPTKLDLRCYEKARVKWLYFTAIKPENPQHRAWLHAIRGPAFGQPLLHARLPPLKHIVKATVMDAKQTTVTPSKQTITPTSVDPGDLDFALGKANNKHDICVYSMQVYPLQQDFTTDPICDLIKESSDMIPPRILQSVHGFFNLKCDHPTRLNLCDSWDKTGVKGKVQFYIVDAQKGIPRSCYDSEKPTLFKKKS